MLHAVIMAGGSGTRFWPASRNAVPKQLLNLAGERTMIQATADRLAGLMPSERIWVATNSQLADAIMRQLPELPAANFLLEPCKRDTAACIGLAAITLAARDPSATMAVMPSDHVITPADKLRATLSLAAEIVEENPQRFVTLGISPTFPATSFGYIERGSPLPHPGVTKGEASPNVFKVAQFREKPTFDKAKEYLASGKFYWNSGIFVWKASAVLEALATYQPELHARLQTIAQAIGKPDYPQVLEREFAAVKGISIDYAVMERVQDIAVIEAPFEWDDVGSWQSLARLAGKDQQGNTVIGRHIGLRTTDSIVRGDDGHLIVTLGIKDCIVVHTPDATLVASRDDEEAIREAVKRIQELGWTEFL